MQHKRSLIKIRTIVPCSVCETVILGKNPFKWHQAYHVFAAQRHPLLIDPSPILEGDKITPWPFPLIAFLHARMTRRSLALAGVQSRRQVRLEAGSNIAVEDARALALNVGSVVKIRYVIHEDTR